jgi:hypothetical protein
MMRAITFTVPPEAPANLTVAAATTGLNLSWTDNSASETGFTLERAGDAGFTAVVDTAVPPITGSTDINGQGITWGGTQTYNDQTATAGPYFYRVREFKPDASYWTSGVSTSAWSNPASLGPTAGVSPVALAFGILPVGTPSTPQTVTLSNTGTGPLCVLVRKLPSPASSTRGCCSRVRAGSIPSDTKRAGGEQKSFPIEG